MLRRHFKPSDGNDAPAGATSQGATPPPKDNIGNNGGGDRKETPMVPLSALHEARDEMKTLKAKLKEIEERDNLAKEKQLAEEGKYQELLTQKEQELETLRKKEQLLTAYEERANSVVEEQLQKLNDDDQLFAKKLLEGKSVLDQQEILEGFVSRVQKKDPASPGKPKHDSDAALSRKAELEKQRKEVRDAGDVTKLFTVETLMKAEGFL